jgi:GLPGLI family protein
MKIYSKIIPLSIFAICLNVQYTFSQNSVENAYLLCKYKVRSILDTSKRGKIKEDITGLEIGKNGSRYFSIYNEERAKELEEWKIKNGDKPRDISLLLKASEKSGTPIKIYKYYKINQITTFDNIAREAFTYEEENPDFGWKILPDTMTILNQICQKATCIFRGRNYEAWFAQGINVSEGPWKFNGLPGLILKITDSKQDYSFEAISIEKIDYPIAPKPIKAIISKRTVFNRIYREFAANPMGAVDSSKQKELSENSNDPFVKKMMKYKLPYNPMELTDN